MSNPSSTPARAASIRWLILGLAIGVVGAGLAAVVIGGPLIVGHRQDLPLEKLYGSYAVSAAARLSAGNATNPEAQNPRAIRAGRDAYTGSCSQCHGEKGDGKGVFGTATYPVATDLTTHDAQEKSDAQLFWIVKYGLSFTGMPGFANQYSDQDIWSIVSYLRALQQKQAPAAATMPTPTAEQLAMVDPTGDAVHRGAAVYHAQGCASCHGPVGNAPGELGLRGGGREANEAVREGRRGMPSYDNNQITEAQLADLTAYMNTFRNARGGFSRE